MANEILLVNPRRRRRKTAARRRPVRRRRTYRRRNPVEPRTRGGRLGMYVSNPRRRRRTTRAVRRRRYRRNPNGRGMFNMQRMINNIVVPAATAGAGAVALDVVWGFVPIPPEMKTGPMRHVVKGFGAILLGQVAGMMFNRRIGDNMALGALTVSFYNAFRETTAQFMPQVPLGYYSAGVDAGYDPSLGYYVESPALTTQAGESVPTNEMGYYVQEQVGAQY